MTTKTHDKKYIGWLWRLEWGQTQTSRKTELEEALFSLQDEPYWAEHNLHFEVEEFPTNAPTYIALRMSHLDSFKPEFYDTEIGKKVSIDINENTKRLDDVWLLFDIRTSCAYVAMTYNTHIKTLATFVNILTKKFDNLSGIAVAKVYDVAKIEKLPNQITKMAISGTPNSLKSVENLVDFGFLGLGKLFAEDASGYECEVNVSVNFKPKKNEKNKITSRGPSSPQESISAEFLAMLDEANLNLKLSGTEYCFDTNKLQMKKEFSLSPSTSVLHKQGIFSDLAKLLTKEQTDNGILMSICS